jgi:arylsulfatase A-like enzyme
MSLLKRRLEPVLDSLSLPKDSPTVAEALSEAGYATGCFGKWQNGEGRENSAKGRGFSVSTDKKAPKEKLNDDPKGVYSVAEDVCDFMETNRNRPFFAYVSYHGIHMPLQARPETFERFKSREPGRLHNNPLYAACTYDLDDSAGIILEKLDQLGLRENTIVIFTSDNGGVKSSMEPLRGAKGCYYEGGIRVPLFVRWPGVIEPGATCAVPVNNIDFYPTFLSLAGAAVPEGKLLDGVDMLPLLTGAGSLKRDSLFWHYPGYQSVPIPRGRDTVFRTPPVSVIRKGNWKLHLFHEEWVLDGGSQDPAGSKAVELYNLKDDPGEHSNLAASKPEKRDELLADLLEWIKETGAPISSEPNPTYDPTGSAGTEEKL